MRVQMMIINAVPFSLVPNLPLPFLPLFLLLPFSGLLSIISPVLSNTHQILSDAADDYPGEVRHCSESDLLFQYTPCDQNNKRWLYAVPRSHNFLCSADSVPPPRHGLNCSVICPAGHFLEMHSQKCEQCKPGTFSLGDRLRFEQFDGDKLPEGFSVENSPTDESFSDLFSNSGGGAQCANGGGWAVEEGELRYRWTHCESTLSIALHLVRPGFAEFRYRISRDSRGLISLLHVRNAQCQSYGGNDAHGTPKTAKQKQRQQQKEQKQSETSAAEGDTRVQRLALRAGQNLITWSVSSDPVLSTRMEMVRLLRLDLSGLAFTPECLACPAGTFADQHGAQQCESCPQNTFSTAGARRCTECATHQWAEPRSEKCQPRPKCQPPMDYHPVRPQQCNGTRHVYQRKIEPTVCLDEPGASSYTALSELEQCPPCALGMYRNPQNGECQKCPEDEVSEDGKVCNRCPPDSQPEFGLFINRWDSFPPGVTPKFECEFVSADEIAGECRVTPAWISHGDRLESVQTRFKGVALEMSIHLSDGFYAPLHSGRVSADNPIGLISVELEMLCEDDSCQFYIVQEIDPPASSVLLAPAASAAPRGELQMLALLNGTQPRRVLQLAAVTTNRPRRLVFAFMRSGALLGHDALSDRAVLYAINATNTGDAQRQRATGTAHRCVHCPRRDTQSGKCLPCPQGEYWANSSCRRCPSGSVLNPAAIALLQSLPNANASSSALSSASPCVPCPPHFEGSADGLACEFSGHFDMDEGDEEEGEGEAEKDKDRKKEKDREKEKDRKKERRGKSQARIGHKTDGARRMHFDISALRETTLTARGIRVFSRDGQSYSHVFNASLFSDRPVQCRDTLLAQFSFSDQQTPAEDGTIADDETMFCRWAAVPIVASSADHPKNVTSAGPPAAELFVSSTKISRKLALITRSRRFGAFRLSDDQLEYDSATPRDRLPLDVHFFLLPSSPSPSSSAVPSKCPNGTLGVITVRCEPSVVAKPLARLSRHCPDGTCDGCLYHILVESVHGCPLCRSDDFREIRGECIDGSQRVHSIPSKHCALSGAQTHERTEPCRVILSQNVRLLLTVAILLILLLSLAIATIYRRNKALEYRYMRLAEGREVDQNTRTSCALIESDVDGSEEEEEEEKRATQQGQKDLPKESHGPRVFFSVRKGGAKNGDKNNGTAGHKRLGGSGKYGKGGKATFVDERTEFIAEEEGSD